VITLAKETGQRFRVLVRDLADPFAAPRILVREFTNEYFLLEGSEARSSSSAPTWTPRAAG